MDVKEFVIYEDENLLIINKPRGMLVQSDGSDTPSLDLLLKDIYKSSHIAPVHRLDRDTSGLVIFGKNEASLKELSNLFVNKEQIEKHYITLVSGHLDQEGEINALYIEHYKQLFCINYH